MNVWADICECLERKKIGKYVQYVQYLHCTVFNFFRSKQYRRLIVREVIFNGRGSRFLLSSFLFQYSLSGKQHSQNGHHLVLCIMD